MMTKNLAEHYTERIAATGVQARPCELLDGWSIEVAEALPQGGLNYIPIDTVEDAKQYLAAR